MTTRLFTLVVLASLVAGCLRKDNPNYCPGLNANNNCAEGDAGVRSCTENSQCSAPAPICDVQAQTCVQCTTAQPAACTGATPICGPDERCRGCASHLDCPVSNVCRPDGACADPGEVAYVSVPGGTDNPMCTLAMPCTKIMKALGTNRAYLKLRGMIDEAVTIEDRSVTLLADPGTVLTRNMMGNILTIDGSSNVRVYDLAINGASGNGAGVSLSIGGNQIVTLSHVSMSENNGMNGAIAVFGGTINISRSQIFNNMGGGISVSMAEFDIENNFITRNGGIRAYGGILLNQTDSGSRILAFNTISGNSNNGLQNTASGVLCSLVSRELIISNNIIYGNTVGLGAQVAGNACSWTYSDIGPGEDIPGSGNLNRDPMFAPGDFHLENTSQLIDKADPNATLNLDIDGDSRPQNGRRDIGADEYVPSRGAATGHTMTADR